MIRHEKWGPATDIWSLGIVLLKLANPILTEPEVRIMYETATLGVIEPIFIEPKAKWSSKMNDFVHAMVAFEPAKRSSATELLKHPFLKAACKPKKMAKTFDRVVSEGVINSMFLF